MKSKKITNIIVTTNDERVIKICKRYNINIPFKRPEYLAKDKHQLLMFINMQLNINKIKNNINEFLVALPTSPLRTCKDVDKQ